MAGRFTKEAGFMAYYEICEKLSSGGRTEVYDETMKSVYAYGDDQRIGYESRESLQHR